MSAGRRVVKPYRMTGSGIVGPVQSAGPVRIHGGWLSETGGTTNLTVSVYVPVVPPGGAPVPAPSASGTQQGTIIIPKGSTLPVGNFVGDDGVLFENGVYFSFAGGTGDACLFIS